MVRALATHTHAVLLLVCLACAGAGWGAAAGDASPRARASEGDRGRRKGAISPGSPAAITPRSVVSQRGNATPRAETPGKFGRLSVRFQDPSPEAPGAEFSRETLAGKHAGLFVRLDEAFGDRAVWSTLALRNTLGVSREVLRETLPYIGYKFRDGPWKGLWTRFGYDPRTNPKARVLQVSTEHLNNQHDERAIEQEKEAIERKRQELICVASINVSHRKDDENVKNLSTDVDTTASR